MPNAYKVFLVAMHPGRKYPFTPILGWSVSRYENFMACKRQYWYEYYAKKYDKGVSVEKLNFLKSLTSLPLEIGNVAHKVIAMHLHRLKNNVRPRDTSQVLGYGNYLVDQAIREKSFLEIHYNQQQEIDKQKMKEQVESCLRTFLQTPWYEWLAKSLDLRKGDWLIEPSDFGEVRINGLKGYCKVDFLFPASEGDVYVIDWKTGKIDEEKHRRQMMGYVLYTKDMFQVGAEQVRTVIVYLGDDSQEIQYTFNEDKLQEFAQQIAVETQDMYQYCKDIEKNIPKPKDFFSKQPSNICNHCNYQELCGFGPSNI